MSRPGTCELGCGQERKLELVDAAAHDELVAAAEAAEASAAAFSPVALALAGPPPQATEAESAYRSLQAAARRLLRANPHGEDPDPAPVEVATTWWCPRCGGVDAPQPCLGICVWRPVEWVPVERYEAACARAGTARADERRLRSLLRRAAAVTPSAGRWEEGWRAFGADARAALGP